MVPEGWDILPLGEMAEFRNGLNFTKGDEGQPIKIVTIPDFWQRTELRDLSGIKSIQPKGKVPATSLLQSGDMLFVRSNGNPELVGRCLFFPEVSELISFSGFTIRGRVDRTRLVPEFAASVMATERTKEQFRRGRGGGNISNLSQDILAGVQVALPPLSEQRKIADILSTWDAAIEKTEALLATARTQKRALMQSLLTGHRRFPEFEGQPWREVRLGELADRSQQHSFIDGDWVESPHITASGNRLIQTGNIGVGEFKDKSKRYISDESFSELRCKEVPVGCILICRLADPAGRACIVPELGERRMLTSVDVTIFKPAKQFSDIRFLELLLNLPKTLHLVQTLCGGSTRTRVARSNLSSMKLMLPSITEQRRIADAIGVWTDEVRNTEKQAAKLRTEKKALMQQLLTGKRRVVV